MTGWPLLLHSMATPDRDAVGSLDTAVRLGLDGIELIVDGEYPSAVRPDASIATLRALRLAAANRGVRVAALCPYPKEFNAIDGGRRRAAVDALVRAVDLAHALGAGHVRVLGGEAGGGLALAAATLRGPAEHASDAGVSLNIENHMDTLATSAARTQDLVDAVGHPAAGILYDQANLTLMGAESPAEAVRAQRHAIRHVHVKDFAPTVDDRRPVPLGTGAVDWPATIRALRRAGYGGAVTFEYERRWYPSDLPPPEIGLPADIELLRRLYEEAACAW